MSIYEFDMLSKEDFERIFKALNVLGDYGLGIAEEAEEELYAEYNERFGEGE